MKNARKDVLDQIEQVENQPLVNDTGHVYDSDIDIFGYKDAFDEVLYIKQDEELRDLSKDSYSAASQKKKLEKKKKDINDNLPREYSMEDLNRLLERQDRLVADLRSERRRVVYDQGNLDDTKAELKEIERVLKMFYDGQTLEENKEALDLTTEQMTEVVKSLRFKKSRDLSQILINDHTKNDSPEMQAVKYDVLNLSYRLETIKDTVVTRDLIDVISTYYAVAIKSCEDYLSTKRHNARYDKVYEVWQSLSYEKDSLSVVRDEDFKDKEYFTMGELLGMSKSSFYDIKRNNPLEDEYEEPDTYSIAAKNTVRIFGDDYKFSKAYDGASKLSAKKKIAKQNYELMKGIRQFMPGQAQVVDVMVKGKKVQILQSPDNSLYVLDHHERIPLDKTAEMVFNELANDMMLRSEYYPPEAIKDLMGDYENKSNLTQGEYTNIRDNCAEYLALKLGIKKDVFNNVRRTAMVGYVKDLASKKKTAAQIKTELQNLTKSENMINGVELTELMELDADRGIALEERISMYKVQADNDSKDWTEDEKAVKNLMAEFVFTSDTLIMDKNADDPKEFVRSVLLSNMKALKLLVNQKDNEDIISSIMKKMSLDEVAGSNNANFGETIGKSIKDFVTFLKQKKYDNIEQALRNKDNEELNQTLQNMHTASEQSIKAASDIMQQNVNKIVEAMFEKTDDSGETDQLRKIMKNATRTEAGQGQFIRNVLSTYFSRMKSLDQRAMLSSVLRSCRKVDIKELSDAKLLEDIKERKLIKYSSLFEKKVEDLNNDERALLEEYKEQKKALQIGANYFAGLIRGAGPLFHKMLQGVPEESLPVEVRLAIRDVKSKLPPIPERVVKTQMNAMIERSNGAITRIEVIKNLGAASVGQTFRCKIYGPDIPYNGKFVVIKLLRPDCQNRMKREESVMLQCAGEVNDGMRETYKGQLTNHYMELDLTQEAKNIKAGAVYNGRYGDVCAEKISTIIEPTMNSLMIEEAPGKTLDDILLDSVKTRQEIYASLREKKYDKNGEIEEVFANIPQNAENVKKTKEARDKLINLANDLIKKRDIMANITKSWIEEALFKGGYYHADLHAGNILISDNMGTLIDFGNAVQFSDEQKTSITKMMTAATASNTKMFFEEFNNLLDMEDENFRNFYTDEVKNQVKDEFDKILKMGDKERAGERISAALIKASELGVKLPPAIYNFSQGQLRLQKSIDEINRQIQEIGEDLLKIEAHFISRFNNSCGLNIMLRKAQEDSYTMAEFAQNLKQQINSLIGYDEEEFVNALIDKTEVEGDEANGIAAIDKRAEFDSNYMGDLAGFEGTLKEERTGKKGIRLNELQDFSGVRAMWNEYRNRWLAEFQRIKEDKTLNEEQRKQRLDEAKAQQQKEGDDNIQKYLPDNMGVSVWGGLGLGLNSVVTVNAAVKALDNDAIENVLFIYEQLIPKGLEVERKVNEFRNLQDEGSLSKDEERKMAKEIYKLHTEFNQLKNKNSNPISSYFKTELQKINQFEKVKDGMQMMLEEPTLKKTKQVIEKQGENGEKIKEEKEIEVPIGKLLEQKLDEYYNLAKKYAPPPPDIMWDMANLNENEADKTKIMELRKEILDIHLEISMMQAKNYYEGRYDHEISIKKFDFNDVMKSIIANNFGAFSMKVGIFNLILMGGAELISRFSKKK